MTVEALNVPAPIARQLVIGTITQVRVPVARRQRLADGRTVAGRCRYHPGDDLEIHAIDASVLAVEDDDREYTHRETDPHPLGRVNVLSVRAGTLVDLTYRDAQREGYRTATWRDDLLADWQLYRAKTNPDQPVWILEVKPQHDHVRRLAVSSRPVGHRDAHDPDRWHGPAGSEHGYTDGPHALPDEPEAVDPAALDHGPARRRHAAARDRHASARQRLRNLRAS